tara:strand:+ start:2088 stop:3167 length:1080 start_codon:yes stop_codon:yes gene_type:complete
MPSSFTSRLKLERQASGENSGTWGNLVNYVLNRVDASVSGFQAVNVAGSANVTLTSNNSTSNTDDSTTDDQVHNATLEFTGALGAAIHVFTDAVEQNYTVFNNTTGSYNLTFANTGHAANGVVLKQGAKTLVYTDGSSVTDVMADLGDVTVTSVTSSGNVAATNVVATAAVSGTSFTGTANVSGTNINATANTMSIAGSAPNVAATTANADLLLSTNGVAGRVTFNGGGKIQQIAEKATVSATAATGTVNFDVTTQAVLYYTTNASGNWTLNIRGDGSNALNAIMDTGESITIVHLVTNGGSAYYNSAVQVDGSGVTPEWQGGSAPTGGNSSSVDVYTYTVFKTGDAAFTVFAAQTQFA